MIEPMIKHNLGSCEKLILQKYEKSYQSFAGYAKKISYLLLSTLVFALGAKAEVNVSLIGMAKSNAVYRGALIWPDPSIMFGPSITINKTLSINGPGLGLRKTFEHFDWGLQLFYFDDKRPLIPLTKHRADYRNQRPGSLELSSQLRYMFCPRNACAISLTLGRELIRYDGLYSEAEIKVPLLPLTSLRGKISYAELSTNKYIYGPTSYSGLGFYGVGPQLFIPFVPWKGHILANAEYSHILQKENQNADYIRGEASHWTYGLMAFWFL